MGREELRSDRCGGLLLAEYMQDLGAAKPDAKTRYTSHVIKCGV